jgi:hypothetical protein
LNSHQFGEWFEGLSNREQDDIQATVRYLSQDGPAAGRPTVDRIEGSRLHNLKELRVPGDIRILFVFDPRRTVILLLGGDKAGLWNDWYVTAIPEAERLYAVYLAELRAEGLLP